MDFSTPFIAPNYVIESLAYPQRKGLSIEWIAEKADVDLRDLSHRTQAFSLNEVLRISRFCSEALNIPHYGLEVGSQVHLTCHGMASIAAMSQNTYADCLKLACRLCDSIFPPLTMEYFESGKYVGIRILETYSMESYSRYLMEWIMASFRNIQGFLIGYDRHPRYVAFPYSRPFYWECYRRYLGCDVYFEAEHAEFAVDRDIALAKLPLADKCVAKIAESHIPQLSVISADDKLLMTVRGLIIKNLENIPSIETVAEQLGLHPRTLRRRLTRHGTSFRELLNQVRVEVAKVQLVSSSKSITEISETLGYTHSSLAKAFKKITGLTPNAYRRENRE